MELINSIPKNIDRQKHAFDFQAHYQDLNMTFVFDTTFYGSNTGYVQVYNGLKQHVPDSVTGQIEGLLARFFMTNNTHKRANVKLTTCYT